MNLQSIRSRARQLKIELLALALAARHPDTPWYARLVVGLIDDIVFVPLAIGLAVRFIPAPVLADCRARSQEIEARAPRLSPTSWVLIAGAWLAVVVLVAYWTIG